MATFRATFGDYSRLLPPLEDIPTIDSFYKAVRDVYSDVSLPSRFVLKIRYKELNETVLLHYRNGTECLSPPSHVDINIEPLEFTYNEQATGCCTKYFLFSIYLLAL